MEANANLHAVTAEIKLPHYTVKALVRAFKEILAQPNVVMVQFSAGEPIRVTYYNGLMDPTLQERLAQTMDLDSLLEEIQVSVSIGDTYNERLGFALLECTGRQLEFNACLVSKQDVELAKQTEYLGLPVHASENINPKQIILAGAASSACSLAEIQALWMIEM